jgi:hypothetical protein
MSSEIALTDKCFGAIKLSFERARKPLTSMTSTVFRGRYLRVIGTQAVKLFRKRAMETIPMNSLSMFGQFRGGKQRFRNTSTLLKMGR